jgi:hypothetical protein
MDNSSDRYSLDPAPAKSAAVFTRSGCSAEAEMKASSPQISLEH